MAVRVAVSASRFIAWASGIAFGTVHVLVIIAYARERAGSLAFLHGLCHTKLNPCHVFDRCGVQQ